MLWDTVLAETRLEQWWWSWRQWQGREIGCRRPQGWEAEMKIFAVRRPRKHGLGGERKNPRKSYEAGVACTGVTTGGSRSKFTLRNVPDSNSGSSIEKDVMSLSFCFISSSSAGRPEQHLPRSWTPNRSRSPMYGGSAQHCSSKFALHRVAGRFQKAHRNHM